MLDVYPVGLDYLRRHWGSAYIIRCLGAESWIAVRKDGKGEVRAASAEELLTAIRIDSRDRPVPREDNP